MVRQYADTQRESCWEKEASHIVTRPQMSTPKKMSAIKIVNKQTLKKTKAKQKVSFVNNLVDYGNKNS